MSLDKSSNKKVSLREVQFYISHTCNLSCPNCLSFNNFNISGHHQYNNETCKQWSNILNISDLTIIGGEPLGNPYLNDWVTGLRKLFPDVADFKICTNGLLLDKWIDEIRQWVEQRVVIEISVHSSKHFDKINASIAEIFKNMNVETFESDYPDYDYPDYYGREYNKIIFYKNFPAFIISNPYEFSEWGVKNISKSKLDFFDSDPLQAHSQCPYKECHYIYNGEMYKCGTLVGAKELIKKYIVDPKSNKLIDSYTPIKLTDSDIVSKLQRITQNAIPQCALCPIGEHNPVSLEDASIKKIPVHIK